MTSADLRAALDDLGWTAAQLASYLPTKTRTVNRYLDGSRKIPFPIQHLILIALCERGCWIDDVKVEQTEVSP
jgi:hypothetical protein